MGRRRKSQRSSRRSRFRFKFPKIRIRKRAWRSAAFAVLVLAALWVVAQAVFFKPSSTQKAMSFPGLTGESIDSRLRGNDKIRYALNDRNTNPPGNSGAAHASRAVPSPVWPQALPATVRPLWKPPRRSGAPQIAFVIDDVGNSSQYADLLAALGNHVTYAILPFLKYSAYFDRLSAQTGAEVILHLPLESTSGTIPGPGLITEAMTDHEVLERLRRNLANVPHAVGANNHMGSKGTADYRIMNIVLSQLRSRGYFFLDSMTTSASAAGVIARDFSMPILRRDIFLDNEDDPYHIRDQIDRLASLARQRGYAVGIGHIRYNTLQVLLEEIPRLQAAGFAVVSLTELLRRS